MANKIVSLLLQVKNKLSPGAREAADDLRKLNERTSELESSLSKFDKAQEAVAGLDSAREAAQEAANSFKDAQHEVEELKAEFKSNKTPDLAVDLEVAKVAAREAKKEWQASAKAVKQLENVVTSAGGDLNDLAATEKKFANEIEFANGKLKAHSEKLSRASKNLKDVESSAKKSSDGLTGFGAKLVGLVAGLAILDKVRDGFSSLAESVFETGSQYELLGKKLTANELGYITEFAKSAPQQMEGVADAFIKARQFGLDPMNGSLRSLVDTNAALGGDQQTLEGIILAVGQAWQKQKFQQEEILQLVERGVPVWDLLSEAMGKTVPELQKMSSAGELGRKEIKLLLDELGGANAGAAAEQMDSMAGLVSNLQDRFSQFYRMVADAGVWDYVKRQIREFSQAFDELAANGRLEKLAKQLSDGFISLAETAKSVALTVYELSGALVALGQAWLGLKIVGWYGQLRNVAAGFGGLTTAAGASASAVKSLGAALRGAIGVVLIQSVYSVVSAYRELKVAVQELDAVQAARAEQQHELAAEFENISKVTGVLVTNMAELEAQIKSGNIVVDEQAGLYLNAAQAAERLADSQRQLVESQSQVALNSDRLSGAYQSAGAALKEAVADNSKLAGVMQSELLTALNGGVEGLGGLAVALRSVEQQGGLTSEQINDALVDSLEKLSEPEQARFGELVARALAQIESGADSAGLRVDQLNRFIDTLKKSNLEAALGRLGTSQEELTNSLTGGFKQSLSDLFVLRDAIRQLGGDSVSSGGEVYTALSGALRNVKTEADKLEFSSAITQFRDEGLITADQYNSLRDSVEEVGDASENMGERGEKGGRRLKDVLSEVSEAAEDSSHDVRAVAAALAGWFQSVRSEVGALSEAARAAFDDRLGIDSTGPVTEIEAVRAALQAARDELSAIATDNLQVFDVTGVNKFKNAVLQAKDETVIAYNEQKVKALEYLEALQSGEPLGRRFLANAERSLNTMNLLGSQDLATLRSALAAANNELQQIRDNASDAVDNLQNQLDQLRGNTDAIAQREYEQKRAELDAKLAEAKAYGDNEAIRSYSQALQLLNQVRQEQIKQAKAAASGSSSAAASTASQSAPAQSTRVVDTVNVNLNVGGETIPVQSSRDDAARLVTVLQEFKNRSGA